MAQVLKDKSREKIIKAAKEEFKQKGYKNASLRNIAEKSGMTVGNLYRYYKNKEDLNKQIVAPTLDKIDETLNALTVNEFNVEARVFGASVNSEGLLETLNEFADKMIEIYDHNKDEFEIVMLHGKLNEKFTKWFKQVVINLIKQKYNPKQSLINLDELANTYASSIWYSTKHLITNRKLKKTEKRLMIRLYFSSFVSMLDNNIDSIISAI